MLAFFARRLFAMVVTLFIISMVVFVVIQLPPGDYLTTYVASLRAQGTTIGQAEIEALERRFGLNEPVWKQYLLWMGRLLRGDMGMSLEWERPVNELVMERIPYDVTIGLFTIVFIYSVAIPIGIYSATHQYSIADYILSFIGFIGLSVPGFMLALVLMFFGFRYFGISVGGLFSSEYQDVAWSLAKLWDLAKHIWIPIVVIGAAGTGGIIRIMRGMLLDELDKQYVTTARVKGVAEQRLLYKYPVRVALNPIISQAAWLLPGIISGTVIVGIVLNLPTTGPLLYRALISQDMYLGGSIIMLLALLALFGTFISDVVLAVVDPRIRLEE